jgi:ABC-type glycerol-3-phosphate transport system substrate-binding protein
VNGHLYAMPWYVTLPALFYNPDLFSAAGLDPRKPPTTWAEFEADAAKLTAHSKGQYGAITYIPNTYLFQGLLDDAGGSMASPDGKKVTFDSPAGEQVLAYQRSLVVKGYMPVYAPGDFYTNSDDLFTSGKLGMLLTSASDYDSLSQSAKVKFKIAPVPTTDGQAGTGAASSNGFIMLATNRARQAATCAALKALITPAAITETVRQTGTVPLSEQVASSPQYLAPYFAANPSLVAVNAQKAQAWFILPGTGDPQFEDTFADTQTQILNGNVAPAKGLSTLAGLANRLIASAQ